jgi:hypothetical protein
MPFIKGSAPADVTTCATPSVEVQKTDAKKADDKLAAMVEVKPEAKAEGKKPDVKPETKPDVKP